MGILVGFQAQGWLLLVYEKKNCHMEEEFKRGSDEDWTRLSSASGTYPVKEGYIWLLDDQDSYGWDKMTWNN